MSESMQVIVVGTGYVGLVTAACLAEVGHQVIAVDIDEEKIKKLQSGIIPIYEPDVEALVATNVRARRLTFSAALPEGLGDADVVIIAVGTPSLPDGHVDLSAVIAAVESLGKEMRRSTVVVNKSTVPVGTGREVERIIRKSYTGDFAVVSCPEFLREGSAVKDFLHPDRIIIGTQNERAIAVMLDLFAPIRGEKLVTTMESAELIKYASNAFLATKISFINEIAHLCERAGADIEEVAYGLGLDRRIGPRFLNAGIGWGGSCFPKDVKALEQIAGTHGYDFKLLRAVIEVNNHQRRHLVEKVKQHFGGSLEGKIIAILGLAFKSKTDDVRESASLDLIRLLQGEGAIIQACDYEALSNARQVLGDRGIRYSRDPLEALVGADAAVIATEWPEFNDIDWNHAKTQMKKAVLFDGRNLLNPKRMRREYGFVYYSIGRNGDEEKQQTI